MSKNIVFEGWLTKSPPTKRIWRAKWRRRWFALRQSGELPGQYFLDYYSDRNCRRLKGTINLDLCEQVDAGLHMERGNGTLDPKLRGSVFTVRTQSRTYHLEAECEAEMEKWVAAICRVCGLRATDDSDEGIGTYQNSLTTVSNDHYDVNAGDLYIPISECTTGTRLQDTQRAFTFDPNKIVTSNRTFERVPNSRSTMYTSQPAVRPNNTDLSDNESNVSDEDCRSLNASQSNIGGDRELAIPMKSFTKLTVSQRNGQPLDEVSGPPVPPRPPKLFQGPKMQEPVTLGENVTVHPSAHGPSQTPWLRIPQRQSIGASPTSPARVRTMPSSSTRYTDDDEDDTHNIPSGHPSLQYSNLASLTPSLSPPPPVVDRALKPRAPRPSSHSVGHIHNIIGQQYAVPGYPPEERSDMLQYLDLDLQPSKTPYRHHHRNKLEVVHGKSLSSNESAYKTVDFLKTEALNITRQDAEALRNEQH